MKTVIIPVAFATMLASGDTSRAQTDNRCADPRFVRALLEDATKSTGAKAHAVTYVEVTDITTQVDDGALLSCHGTFVTSDKDKTDAKFTFSRNSLGRYIFTVTPDDLDEDD